MDFTYSRKSLSNVVGLLLITLVLIAVGYTWSQGWFDRWFIGSQPIPAVPDETPALQSLSILYTPTGERAAWEVQVCAGMTEQGCQLFRALYAGPLWESAQGQTAAVAFVAVADRLEDGSQIWKMNLTLAETSLPVYIHVAQNDAGQWLLHRLLFEQESAQYENG